MFNGIVRLCITEILPALLRFLKVKTPTASVDSKRIEKATKGKLWNQVKPAVKSYLAALTKVGTTVLSRDGDCALEYVTSRNGISCYIADGERHHPGVHVGCSAETRLPTPRLLRSFPQSRQSASQGMKRVLDILIVHVVTSSVVAGSDRSVEHEGGNESRACVLLH